MRLEEWYVNIKEKVLKNSFNVHIASAPFFNFSEILSWFLKQCSIAWHDFPHPSIAGHDFPHPSIAWHDFPHPIIAWHDFPHPSIAWHDFSPS